MNGKASSPEEGVDANREGEQPVRGCDNPDLDRQATDWRRKAADARRALAGSSALATPWRASPSWPLWPGAVRHVQSESLKALPTCL